MNSEPSFVDFICLFSAPGEMKYGTLEYLMTDKRSHFYQNIQKNAEINITPYRDGMIMRVLSCSFSVFGERELIFRCYHRLIQKSFVIKNYLGNEAVYKIYKE